MLEDKIELVSLHGGHSGEFCSHARDTLEEMVLAYIDQGFDRVGITEHMPQIGRAHVNSSHTDISRMPSSA